MISNKELGIDVDRAFCWEAPDVIDSEIMVVAHEDGSLMIEVAEEKAVDSYNKVFSCEITLPLEQAAKLREYLNARVPRSPLPKPEGGPETMSEFEEKVLQSLARIEALLARIENNRCIGGYGAPPIGLVPVDPDKPGYSGNEGRCVTWPEEGAKG